LSQFITEAFIRDYVDAFTLRIQQKESRLRMAVRTEMIEGKKGSFDFIGKRKPNRRTSRHADTILTDTPHDRRWVTLAVYDDADMIDQPDKLRVLTDPTNTYTAAMASGFGREIDEVIADAAAGDAETGEEGSTTQAALTANSIGLTGSPGALDTAKILNVQRLMNGYEAETPRYWAITAQQQEDLLNDSEFQNSDFNSIRALVRGEMSTWAGYEWIRVENPILKVVSTGPTVRRTMAWYRGAIALGVGTDVRGSIDRRPDKNNGYQIFYSMDMGAVRLDDNGVILQGCQE
jgi:hypothetical protein